MILEAFSARLDLVQGILFLVLAVVGGAVALTPAIAATHNPRDLIDAILSTKGAAIVLAAVTVTRICLAPYYIWKRLDDNVRILAKEKDQLNRVISNRNRKINLSTSLGRYLYRGNEILLLCSKQRDDQDITTEFENWANETRSFIEQNLGHGFASKFDNPRGIYVGEHFISSPEHAEAWNETSIRTERLGALITELGMY